MENQSRALRVLRPLFGEEGGYPPDGRSSFEDIKAITDRRVRSINNPTGLSNTLRGLDISAQSGGLFRRGAGGTYGAIINTGAAIEQADFDFDEEGWLVRVTVRRGLVGAERQLTPANLQVRDWNPDTGRFELTHDQTPNQSILDNWRGRFAPVVERIEEHERRESPGYLKARRIERGQRLIHEAVTGLEDAVKKTAGAFGNIFKKT